MFKVLSICKVTKFVYLKTKGKSIFICMLYMAWKGDTPVVDCGVAQYLHIKTLAASCTVLFSITPFWISSFIVLLKRSTSPLALGHSGVICFSMKPCFLTYLQTSADWNSGPLSDWHICRTPWLSNNLIHGFYFARHPVLTWVISFLPICCTCQ